MPKLLFYRQARRDGGLRTGVECNGVVVAESFDEGGSEPDPRIDWYADVRCDGPGVPDHSDQAIPWLASMAPAIVSGLQGFSETLRAGLDVDIYTVTESNVPKLPADVHISLNCKVSDRKAGANIAAILLDLGDHWTEILEGLAHLQAAE